MSRLPLLLGLLASAGSLWSQPISIGMAGSRPEPGVETAKATIEVRVPGGAPLVLDTAEATVTESAKGTRLQGKVGMATPVGVLDLMQTDVSLEYGPAGAAGGFQTFRGRSEVPFPRVGFFSELQPTSPAVAEVSYLPGRALGDLGVPLKPDRHYLAYRVREGLGASLGNLELAVPGGKEVVVVLDPFDPMFFVTGDLPGLSKLGKLEDLGIGLSAQGLIPFAPQTRWGLDARTKTFDGHVFLSGRIPIKQYSMAIEGEGVLRLGKGMGPIPGKPRVYPTALGANGTLYLEVPLLEFTTFDMQLGTASAAAIWEGRRSAAYFSGVGKPEVPFLPEELPVMPEREIKIAGMIDGSRLGASFLEGEGKYVMGLAKLADAVGIELKNLRETSGHFSISKDGFLVKGTTRSQFSPLIKVSGGLSVDSYFSLKEPLKDFHVTLRGDLGVGNIPLGAKASVTLGPLEAAISGEMKTPLHSIALSGNLGRDGVRLAGSTEVTLPIKGLAKVTETVTNGAICGYHVVKDGAKCGWDQVTDSAICGTKVVADGTQCGWDWVTDGTKCGWDKVTDGTVCGWNWVSDGTVCGWNWVSDGTQCGWVKVTDGAKCGWSVVSSGTKCGWEWTKCLINPLKWGKCKKAKKCKVANTCKQPRRCKKPRKCKKPRTCSKPRKCKQPKKCTIAATCKVAKSCKDLSRPRTCERVVKIPDAKLGDLSARIDVEVTHRGASGAVSGQYCTGKDKCLSIGGGEVVFDPKPEACVTIPGVGKRVCFGF